MRSEIAFNIILIGLAIFLLKLASTFTGISKYDTIGPDFWPTIILSLLLGLSTILFISNLIKAKAKRYEKGEKSNDTVLWPRLILSIMTAFIYFVVMHYAGFVLSTLAFQVVFLLIQGVKKAKTLVISPLILTGILFILFIKLMYLPLPKGIGVFRSFSLLFY